MLRKFIYTSLLTVCGLPVLTAQTLTNAGLETWEEAPIPNIYDIEFPTEWNGSDKLISDNALLMGIIGITPEKQVFKTTDKYEGEFAARLETKFLGDTIGNIPGLLVNADLTLNMEALAENPDITQFTSFINFASGTPLLGKKCDTVKAWVKAPATNEEDASLTVYAFQVGPGSNGEDTLITIGSAEVNIAAQGDEYFELVAPLIYSNPENTATDTLIIAFSSSAYTAPGQNIAGNTLFVDDVSIITSEGNTGINQPLFSDNELQVFPNPSNGKIQVSINTGLPVNGLQLIISDVQGRVQHQSVLQQAVSSFDFSTWPAGLYLYQIKDDASGRSTSGKLSIR